VRAQFARFAAVGPIGLAAGALQYELLWHLNPIVEFRAATTWLMSAILGVAWVHALHCRFTFRGTASARWRETIGRAYLLYATSIALGSGLMWLLVDELGMRRTVVWVLATALTSLLNFVLLRRLLAAPPAAEGAVGIALDDLCVIVPTKNERANVAAFVASLPDAVHLMVLDASDDDTAAQFRALRPERTTVLRCLGNIPTARQRGAEATDATWLLFTDADVEFAPGYFERLAALRLGARCGGIVGAKASLSRYRRYFRLFVAGQRVLHWLGIPAATGSNMLMRREALLACGGFDLRLSVNEDSEVMWRCQRAGFDIQFAPALVVYERDHRRLDRGVARKLIHTAVRCAALYLGVLPQRWRLSDWGYWQPRPVSEELSTGT
jgi:putative flippase GtrA